MDKTSSDPDNDLLLMADPLIELISYFLAF